MSSRPPAGSPGWVQHLVSDGYDGLELPPGDGGRGGGVDPGRDRALVAGRRPRELVAPGRGGQRRLGAGRLGVRGSLRGDFRPGLSWLFGAPGAVLLYCFAGVLVALPEAAWAGPRLGRVVLRVMGAFFVGMALLQAWPGRGFWQGQPRPNAVPGQLTGMAQQMAQTPQPGLLSGWVAAFGRFDAAHGWAVNLFVVLALAGIGATFLSAQPRWARVGVIAGTVLCAATWVLVQDFGFFGGIGTDPNSMVPIALLLVAGYLALTRAPAVAPESTVVVPIWPADRQEAPGDAGWPRTTLRTCSARWRPWAPWVSCSWAPFRWPWPPPWTEPTR